MDIASGITCESPVMGLTSDTTFEPTVRDLSSWISGKPTVLSKVMDVNGIITYGSTVILYKTKSLMQYTGLGN